MLDFRLWLEDTHDFSSVQVDFPEGISRQIVRFGKDLIDDGDIYKSDGEYGREDEVHVTVLYGLHDRLPDKVREILKDEDPITLRLGSTSVFNNNPEFDVVKLGIESDDLHRINSKLCRNCEYTNDYPKYQPHCTLAYVKKGTGKKYSGNDSFKGKELRFGSVIFSSKTGKKTRISLG